MTAPSIAPPSDQQMADARADVARTYRLLADFDRHGLHDPAVREHRQQQYQRATAILVDLMWRAGEMEGVR